MMIHEFTARTGYEPSFEEYRFIEDSYYEFDGQKDEFCKWFKKAQKSGEWEKELILRKRIADMEESHKKEMDEKEETLEFYRPYFDRANVAENILMAIGKAKVEMMSIKIKDEKTWRKFGFVKVRYIDNGTIRFINLIEESGWITSIKISDIECVEMR